MKILECTVDVFSLFYIDLVPGKAITMSSYPGVLLSGDDYYLISSGLVCFDMSYDARGSSGFLIRSDTSCPVQSQKQAKSLKKRKCTVGIAKRKFDLHLCFSPMHVVGFLMQWLKYC